MIIEPGKESSMEISIGVSLVILWSGFTCLITSTILCALVGLLILLALVPFIISSTRTFEMNSSGCIVRWLGYQKTYRWDEFELKQYVHYKGVTIRASRSPCFHAAEFSPKNVKIPKRMDAHAFSALFHPLSFVFVYFPKKTWNERASSMTKTRYPVVYEADEEELRAKLQEWGVEMVEAKRGIFADDDNWHETTK